MVGRVLTLRGLRKSCGQAPVVEGGGRRVLVRIDEDKLRAFCVQTSIPESIGLLNPMGHHFAGENAVKQISGKKAHGPLIVLQGALPGSLHGEQQGRAGDKCRAAMTHLQLADLPANEFVVNKMHPPDVREAGVRQMHSNSIVHSIDLRILCWPVARSSWVGNWGKCLQFRSRRPARSGNLLPPRSSSTSNRSRSLAGSLGD